MNSVRRLVFFGGILAIVLAAAIVTATGGLQNPQNVAAFKSSGLPLPGIGLRSLSLVNLLAAFAMTLMLLELLEAWRRIGPKFLGFLTAILAFIGFVAAIAVIINAVSLFILMISLLFSPPFGTAAYMTTWGGFPTDESKQTLAILIFLQCGGMLAAILSNPTLLKNIWLLLLGATAIVLTLLLGILHSFPSFLVSITDAVGAIVAGIAAAIWMVLFFFSGVKSALRAIKNTVTSPGQL